MPRPPFGSPEWLADFEEFIRRKVPDVVTPTGTDRFWVGGTIQVKGRIQAKFDRQIDATYLSIDVSMIDPAPIFILCNRIGLPRPTKPAKSRGRNPSWHVSIVALRALRALQETLPILLGERLKEAETAITFFSPNGFRRGRFGNRDVWPVSGFPWRTKDRDLPPAEDDEVQEALNGFGGA
jgi:hypothetical protein